MSYAHNVIRGCFYLYNTYIHIMKPTNIYKKVSVFFVGVVLLSLVFSSLTPSTAFAQQDPGAGGVSSWMNRLFGGSNLGDTAPTQSGTNIPGIPQIVVDIVMGGGQSQQPTNTSNPTGGFSVNNISGIITNVYNNPLESAGNVIQGGLGLVVNMLNGVATFVENPISSTINGVVGAYVEIGNQLQWWSNDGSLTGTTFGDPGQVIQSGTEAIVGGIVEITNEILNAFSDPSTSPKNEPATVIPDAEGIKAQPVDAKPSAKPGSSGVSIPGASKGTVGNPFSDGTDKDDAKSSNKEDQSNPYLFEYDPSSTNNNPSGDGAIEQ